jgi:hypothetical protein
VELICLEQFSKNEAEPLPLKCKHYSKSHWGTDDLPCEENYLLNNRHRVEGALEAVIDKNCRNEPWWKSRATLDDDEHYNNWRKAEVHKLSSETRQYEEEKSRREEERSRRGAHKKGAVAANSAGLAPGSVEDGMEDGITTPVTSVPAACGTQDECDGNGNRLSEYELKRQGVIQQNFRVLKGLGVTLDLNKSATQRQDNDGGNSDVLKESDVSCRQECDGSTCRSPSPALVAPAAVRSALPPLSTPPFRDTLVNSRAHSQVSRSGYSEDGPESRTYAGKDNVVAYDKTENDKKNERDQICDFLNLQMQAEVEEEVLARKKFEAESFEHRIVVGVERKSRGPSMEKGEVEPGQPLEDFVDFFDDGERKQSLMYAVPEASTHSKAIDLKTLLNEEFKAHSSSLRITIEAGHHDLW